MTTLEYRSIDSPVGPLLLAGRDGRLHRLGFVGGLRPARPAPGWRRAPAAFREPVRQLAAYFGGELREFDLPLEIAGTEFQKAVWSALLEIPYGETESYGGLAARLGRPQASRAVGAANGANPIAIVIPCHRVIGASGMLTGFGGGLPAKQRLLALESDHTHQPRLL